MGNFLSMQSEVIENKSPWLTGAKKVKINRNRKTYSFIQQTH